MQTTPIPNDMSDAERQKWDARYAAGAYAGRQHPSQLVADWIEQIRSGLALDVACGTGRNALYLASHGFVVDAVDISSVALEKLRRTAADRRLSVQCHEIDLDREASALPDGPYDVIVLVRYVNLPLYRELVARLAPDGILLTEQHLETDQTVVGPRDRAFRLRPGTLRAACSGLTVLSYFEGLVTDPDDRVAALAQLVARKSTANLPNAWPRSSQ